MYYRAVIRPNHLIQVRHQLNQLEMLALGYGLPEYGPPDCGLPMKLLERLHPGLWVATQARWERRREYTVLTLLPPVR